MPPRVGVLALQGDFSKHIEAVRVCGAEGVEVRTPPHLSGVERLIIPGGESTTLGILLRSSGLYEAISSRIGDGMPVWGTCMGMILLAHEVEGREQFSFAVLDAVVRRNAFGRQVHSFEADVPVAGLDEPFHAVFIRAPVVVSHGASVEELASVEGQVVMVRQGALLATSFHPELTDDRRLHEMFLGMV